MSVSFVNLIVLIAGCLTRLITIFNLTVKTLVFCKIVTYLIFKTFLFHIALQLVSNSRIQEDILWSQKKLTSRNRIPLTTISKSRKSTKPIIVLTINWVFLLFVSVRKHSFRKGSANPQDERYLFLLLEKTLILDTICIIYRHKISSFFHIYGSCYSIVFIARKNIDSRYYMYNLQTH